VDRGVTVISDVPVGAVEAGLAAALRIARVPNTVEAGRR
jgi:hypothetical protein